MLKRVSIQNFKSLKDVTLDLQKVNLLIGPNNSGKTNFLKALEMITKLINSSQVEEDYDQITFKRRGGEIVFLYSYFGEWLKATLFSNISINQEKNFFEEHDGATYTYGYGEEMREKKEFKIPIPINYRRDFLKLWGEFFTYSPNISLITQPADLRDETVVSKDCSNIVPFVFNLSQNFRKNFTQVEDGLKQCVGDLFTVSTPLVETEKGAKLKLKFFDTDNNDYWADDVSDGVLFFFALLCIINQPNPPKLLLLEEPEKGIHPRRIREVMDFIFRLAEEKDVQIILTTHNEHVLDEFATRPESVFVFDKDDEGATYIRNLQRDIIEPTNERNRELDLDPVDLTSNLSENWLYGLLGGVPAIP